MTYQPRNIGDVVAQIVEVLPDNNNALILEMVKIVHDSAYKAPEMKWVAWELLSEAISDVIPHIPTEEWHINVCSILSTKSVDTIKAEISVWKADHETI